MPAQRLNKKYNINTENKNFSIELSVVDKKIPVSICIDGCTWIQPEFEYDEYSEEINDLKKRFNKKLYELIKKSNFNEQNYIVDLNIKESGVKFNKKSFISFQIHLISKDSNFDLKNEKDLKQTETFVNDLIKTSFIEKDFYYSFSKK